MTDSPFVRETSKLADRNFTGSVTATSGERSVSIYLSDGDVVGVSAPGFKAPEGAYVLYRTGRNDLANSETPLLDAVNSHDANGTALMDVNEVGAFRRDWAYGLLASALTWDNPRVSKAKDAEPPTSSRIEKTRWSEVKASVDSRIQNLLMSWTTICRYLMDRYQGEAPILAVSEGAAKIGALVQDSKMFLGPGESLDGVATRVGYSRYRTLRELAKVLRNGGTPVRIGPYTQSADLGTPVLVPELLEDKGNEHVTRDKLEHSLASETSDFTSVPQAETPQIESAPAAAPEPDSGLNDIDSMVTFETSYDRLDDDIDFGIEDAQEPEAVIEPDPEPEPQEEIVTEDQAVELDHEDFGQEITSRHEVHKLAEWAIDRDPNERELRHEILQGMIESSAEKASQGLDELDSVTDDFAAVVESQRQAIAESKRAAENFAHAEKVVAERQHEASQTRVWAEDAIAKAQRAEQSAGSASAEVDAVREAIEEAKRLLAEREAALDPAIQEATRAEEEAHSLREHVLNEVNPALAKADSAVEDAHTNLLNPATLVLGKAQEVVQARTNDREAAHARVYEKGGSVARSLEVAATMAELTPEGADVIDPLANRFQEIRDRFGVIGGEQESSQEHSGDVEHVSPEQLAFAEEVVDTYVEDVNVNPVFEDEQPTEQAPQPQEPLDDLDLGDLDPQDEVEGESLDLGDLGETSQETADQGETTSPDAQPAQGSADGAVFDLDDLDFEVPAEGADLPSFDEVVNPERH